MQKQHTLLADNTQVPFVGFGTYLVSNEEAAEVVGTALDLGYRHIDTAEGYGNEECIGRALKARLVNGDLDRDELFITTKLWPGNPNWGEPVKTFDATIDSLNQSLKKLKVEYVDLYLIHAPADSEPRKEQWRALVELQRQGKAKSIGVSNFTEQHIEELIAEGLPIPAANQVELHPWSQKHELISYMRDKGILPIAYSSLVPLSTWRSVDGQESVKTEQMQMDGNDSNSPFKRLAKKYDVTESQFLLRWAIENGFPVLPKTNRLERMLQNMDLFNFSIEQTDLDDIRLLNRDESVAWQTGDPSQMMS